MNPVQVWMFFCVAVLAWLYAVGVPASELRAVAWVLSAACVVGLLVDGIVMVLESRS